MGFFTHKHSFNARTPGVWAFSPAIAVSCAPLLPPPCLPSPPIFIFSKIIHLHKYSPPCFFTGIYPHKHCFNAQTHLAFGLLDQQLLCLAHLCSRGLVFRLHLFSYFQESYIFINTLHHVFLLGFIHTNTVLMLRHTWPLGFMTSNCCVLRTFAPGALSSDSTYFHSFNSHATQFDLNLSAGLHASRHKTSKLYSGHLTSPL